MYKTRLIVRLLSARDEWELLINHVGLKRSSIGGVSGAWSVKNIIAHVMAHEHYLADRLAEIARGEAFIPCQTQETLNEFIEVYGYPDFESPLMSADAANEWVYQKYKNIEIKELIADELQAFDAILSQIRSLSEDQLNQPGVVRKIKSATLDHYRHHGADIRNRFKHSILRAD
jgi:hypothetical protein